MKFTDKHKSLFSNVNDIIYAWIYVQYWSDININLTIYMHVKKHGTQLWWWLLLWFIIIIIY